MGNRLNLYALLLLLFLSSCDSKDHPPKEDDAPVVNKNAFIASLRVSDRYWRVEELRIKEATSTQDINFFPFTSAVDYGIATSVVPNASFHFDPLTVDELICNGPYGNMPYPTASRMEVTALGLTNDGSWGWNDERQTIEIKLPGMMSSIISSASRSKFRPKIGYLDNKVLPRFLTLSQAQNATEPERISVVVEEDDAAHGKICYNLILRSSWIIERDGGTPKVPSYKVHY